MLEPTGYGDQENDAVALRMCQGPALGARGTSAGRRTPRDPDDYYGCPVSTVLVFFSLHLQAEERRSDIGTPGPSWTKTL